MGCGMDLSYRPADAIASIGDAGVQNHLMHRVKLHEMNKQGKYLRNLAAGLAPRGASPAAKCDPCVPLRYSLCRCVDGIRRGNRTAVLETVPVLGQQLLERREQDQDIRLAARITHETDSPDLALER